MPPWPALAISLLAAAAPAPERTRGGPAESAFNACWQKNVTAPCARRASSGEGVTVDQCAAELVETKCVAERAAYEKELAAALASDVLELLSESIQRVCAAETAAGRGAPQDAIAAGWRDALEVRSEYMRACAAAGREARECDDRANEAERRARDRFCAAR